MGRAQQAKPEPRPLLVGVLNDAVAFNSSKRKGELENLINDRKDEAEVQTRVASVVYADPKLDITSAIIAVLNDPENLKKRAFR